MSRTLICTMLVATLAVLAVAAASGAGFPPFPGTYVPASSKALNGSWRVVMARGGRYVMYRNGVVVARGIATPVGAASAQRVRFADTSGAGACRGATANGLYHWEFGYVDLVLTTVHDPCASRRAVLARVWKI